jgi:hypothetical protein
MFTGVDEHTLLQRAVDDLSESATEIEGFEFAAALAERTKNRGPQHKSC